jgi:hypothetical protein
MVLFVCPKEFVGLFGGPEPGGACRVAELGPPPSPAGPNGDEGGFGGTLRDHGD